MVAKDRIGQRFKIEYGGMTFIYTIDNVNNKKYIGTKNSLYSDGSRRTTYWDCEVSLFEYYIKKGLYKQIDYENR